VKLRFVRTGDFAVVGWEAAVDHPGEPSSLVLARHTAEGGWTLAGKVGSGLTGRTVRILRPYLVERARPVFREVSPPAPGRLITWTEPRVVVEVRFTDWTDEGRLRHPVFLRVREDKPVTEAVGEGSNDQTK
jgi:bifunctional non-homologous end joining protein LigD